MWPKMIPNHLKAATVVHLVLAVGLLASVAVVTQSALRGRTLSDTRTLLGLQQLQTSTLINNCSALESELEALKNSSSEAFEGFQAGDDEISSSDGLEGFQGKSDKFNSSSEASDQFQGDDDHEPQGVIRGYVLSAKVDERFNSSKKVLDDLHIEVHRAIPIPYQSEDLQKALESLLGSGRVYKDREKKAFSNRMTFLNLFQSFVDDKSAKLDSWHFFFENDIALNPGVTPQMAREAIVEGMEVAAADGIMYLGICRPRECSHKTTLKNGLKASRCFGVCTHAFGLTKWKAAGFLSFVHKIKLPANDAALHLDLILRAYANQVHKIWILGVNLKSPVRDVKAHFGLLYQDQIKFPSIIETTTPEKSS